MAGAPRCAFPRWKPTRKQIREVMATPYYRLRGYTPLAVREVPVRDVHDLIPFRQRKYAEHYMDPKGGPRYVKQLADLLRRCVPLPPAHGYIVDGRLHISDGHHRTNAAIVAGLRTIPIVVWKEPA